MNTNERSESDSLARWKRVRTLGQEAFSIPRREALMAALQDEAASVRVEAIHFLGRLRIQDAIAPLSELALHDTSFVVRKEAVIALKDIDSERAVPALIQALDDKVTDVRLLAVDALIKIGSPEAIAALGKALKDEDFNVRYRVQQVLERFKSLLLA